MKSRLLKRLGLAVFSVMLVLGQTVVSFAADTDKNSAETAFVRAKLTLVNEEGLKNLTEDLIQFSDDDKWTLGNNDYYYYKDPLEDGAQVEFIKGVHIPESWANVDSDKKFRIVVTAEIAENVDGEANWSDGVIQKDTSTVTYRPRNWGSRFYETKDLDIEITEYELDAGGNRIPYANDKTVLPGEDVDKIVVLTVHVSADSKSKDHGDRDYDDDDDDDGTRRGSTGGTRVIPIDGDNKGTRVIPIDDGHGPGNGGGSGGIPSIFTGDNSHMILFVVLAAAAVILAVMIIPKKRKKKDSGQNK